MLHATAGEATFTPGCTTPSFAKPHRAPLPYQAAEEAAEEEFRLCWPMCSRGGSTSAFIICVELGMPAFRFSRILLD